MPPDVTVERMRNELSARGIAPDQPLTPELLFPIDQFHFHGIDAVRAAAGLIGLGREHRVLEIGSGLGGPARYLAHTVGCQVTALELRQELHDAALDLTRRVRLNGRVSHLRGDALTQPFEVGRFDAVLSWLAVHQIPERPHLVERMGQAVRQGGRIYIEDLTIRDLSSREEYMTMRDLLKAATLTDAEDFAQEIEDAGFAEIDMTDMTPSWAAFCRARVTAFAENRERHLRVHGEELTARLEQYFATVERLFTSGTLGGIRISAKNP